ncbi:MAG: inositol monophosphatase [Deltaproteobacteria bacterium]|nr:inositol monophosphatase [Deltaproteobacteria bacterium]
MTDLNSAQLQDLLWVAVHAARRAAEVISQYRHVDLNVRIKGEGTLSATVVTEVDVQSQAVVVETLRESMRTFDLALLTEETPDDGARLIKDAFWCIDPLDGTLPFIEKKPGYAVSISLISKEAVPLVGVVLDPEHDALYTAFKGGGAFCNGKRIQMDATQKANPLTVIIDRSAYESDALVEMTQLAEQVAQVCGYASTDIFNFGGAAMNALLALTRAPGCYLKFPRTNNSGGSLWDYGATACIYKEAGAVATDLFGAPLDLNRPDSTYMNHRGFIYATDIHLADALTKACKPLLGRFV